MKACSLIPYRLLTGLTWLLLGSCTHYAYYQSSFHAPPPTDPVQPLRADSSRSALYGGASIRTGLANDYLQDDVTLFSVSLYRTHTLGLLEAWYGVNGSLGVYRIASITTDHPAIGVDTSLINAHSGNKTIGGYGAGGGLNLAIPLGGGHELRLPGLFFYLQKEAGDFLAFRHSLPDSAANAIYQSNWIGLLGLSGELAFHFHSGGQLAFRLQYGANVVHARDYGGNDSSQRHMQYFSDRIAFSYKRCSFYALGYAGNTTLGLQLGFSYRLAVKP